MKVKVPYCNFEVCICMTPSQMFSGLSVYCGCKVNWIRLIVNQGFWLPYAIYITKFNLSQPLPPQLGCNRVITQWLICSVGVET